MIKIINNDYNDTVAIKMQGEITTGDYETILPLIERKIKKNEEINFYCELEDFEKMEPGAIWKDLKFDTEHYDDFKKVALVGDQQWMEWMSKFAKPFTAAEVKYFNDDKKEEAWKWVTRNGGVA